MATPVSALEFVSSFRIGDRFWYIGFAPIEVKGPVIIADLYEEVDVFEDIDGHVSRFGNKMVKFQDEYGEDEWFVIELTNPWHGVFRTAEEATRECEARLANPEFGNDEGPEDSFDSAEIRGPIYPYRGFDDV